MALALELEPTLSYRALLAEVTQRRASPVRPLQVGGGLCKEVVVAGEGVDLETLAPPLLQAGNGQPCLGSWAILVVQAPGGGRVHWEVLPLMVMDGRTLAGRPPRDSAVGRTLAEHEVRGLAMPFALLIVAVEPGHAGIADQVVSVLRGAKFGVNFQYVMVVEDDVDATNYTEALHAAMTRCHPDRGIQVYGLAPGHPLIPFLDLHDKMHSRGAALTLDATTPVDGDADRDTPRRMSFDRAYPEEIRARVVDGWESTYGLPAAPGRWR